MNQIDDFLDWESQEGDFNQMGSQEGDFNQIGSQEDYLFLELGLQETDNHGPNDESDPAMINKRGPLDSVFERPHSPPNFVFERNYPSAGSESGELNQSYQKAVQNMTTELREVMHAGENDGVTEMKESEKDGATEMKEFEKEGTIRKKKAKEGVVGKKKDKGAIGKKKGTRTTVNSDVTENKHKVTGNDYFCISSSNFNKIEEGET